MKSERSCGSYAFGLYEKAMPPSLSLSEKLSLASRCGYDFMEISIDETEEKLSRLTASAPWRRELTGAMADTGTPITTMCLSGHRKYPLGSADSSIRGRGMEIMKSAIIFAADLGIRIIQIAGYDAYYEPSTETTQAFFAENLAASVEFASRYGVCLAFETMETPFMNTIAKALRFVYAINSPYLQVYPDVGNITNALDADHARVRADILGGAGHIVAVHLKESTPGVFREVPYGEGHVDFDICIRSAFEAGARIFLSEFWHRERPDWEERIVAAHAFLRAKLDRSCKDDEI